MKTVYDVILAFAGLWDRWRDRATDEETVWCTIIVCGANRWMQTYHDRMPVILDEKNLGCSSRSPLFARAQMRIGIALRSWPVSQRINRSGGRRRWFGRDEIADYRRFERSTFAITINLARMGHVLMFGLDTVESVAHVIQVALTPVFLLSGIASLLGVLSTRLARVADRVDALAEQLEAGEPIDRRKLQRRLAYLRRRSHVLDAAVMMGTLGGVATSCAGLLLFVGTLRDQPGISLFVAFGLALLFTMGALIAFLIEMLLASRGLRDQADYANKVGEMHELAAEGVDESTHVELG
jgi:cytochrome c biogenesis protein CcdA